MRIPGALFLLTAALAAQKMPLPDGSGRIVRVFDLDAVCQMTKSDPAPARPNELLTALANASEQRRDQARAVADMLTSLLDPKLGPDDDLQVLGDRRLVLLGSPAHVAAAERLLKAAGDNREKLVDVEVLFLRFDAKAFQSSLQGKLTAVQRGDRKSFEAVVAAVDVDTFLADAKKLAVDTLEAPTLTVFPLQRAQMAMRTQTSYVKDYVVKAVDGAFVADPVVDVVWDGNETEVCATILPDGMLGVSCRVAFQDVEKPIAKFDTKLPGTTIPATLQLPRVSGTRLQQTAVLPEGAMVVLAAPKADGSWLVALIRARLHAR